VSLAFPKSLRLRKRADIVGVQRSGKAIHSRYFVLVIDITGRGRVGITVSKKVGNAVIRNRVKRLVREFARTFRPLDRPDALSWLPTTLDVVVIAKRNASRAKATELWSDLQRAHVEMMQFQSSALKNDVLPSGVLEARC